MTPRDRFLRVLNFEKPDDRLPMVEWAAWWDKTIERWNGEGLPATLSFEESLQYFGLDHFVCFGAATCGPGCPTPATHGAPIVTDVASYEAVLPHLYPLTATGDAVQNARDLCERYARSDMIVHLWLDGFFWWPRTLLGIENHLLAFYDQPELMHRLNRDLVAHHLRTLEALLPVLTPDMVGFAEDMSYNKGPMLSRDMFNEFLLPYYRQLIPRIKEHGIKVLIDSDGDITRMIPWMLDAGIEGVYPLERQAGVDLNAIRREYPRFLMMGGYDKMVMPKGEAAMRTEFERLLPAMKSGGYLPAVDHQTPPGVSLENYRTYLRLLREYAEKAART